MLRVFFPLISFSAIPLNEENELISGGGVHGPILAGNSFLSQIHLEILKRTSDLLMRFGEQRSMGHVIKERVPRLN